MALRRPSVEGPEFAQLVRQTNETVRRLEENRFDFQTVPEFFAKDAAADVFAKEIVHVHDGNVMTRYGRLVMGGVGSHFNLMGPIPPNAKLTITQTTILQDVNRQLKSKGLGDLPEYRKLGRVEEIEFYNYEIFYTLRDLAFWLLLHDAGSFPSSLEVMVRHIAAGNIVQSNQYAPRKAARNQNKPALMAAGCLAVSFPTDVVEWMDKPIYGGLAKDTIHVETLLTTKKTDVSHPYLPLEREGKLKLNGRNFFYRRFTGITPKDSLRGPNIKAENASDKY
jgi:hypothetical protein